ncbi:cation diffusion facilitator family transporter [Mucilaginibacter calamicampi]|uniref:Cation diffusion facilitator family transporter n=1 Tax=Mucilaginibacter calamicampi TaxID=1302352 RepID=A0ABW2YTZ5_9SPHI
MSHDHSHHHHDHAPKLDHINKAFIWGIILNSVFVVVEAIAGFITGSLSLLTDAGHNLSDVASLALALLAFKMAKVSSSKLYTYGYKRATILVSFFNAIILVATVLVIVYEAVMRFIHPQPISGETVAWVALVGIAINGFTAWLFIKDKDKDLNIKGAYMHMAVDAMVSLGVVISGVIILLTRLWWIDSLVSIIIAIVILRGTWSLFKDSLRLEMDGVPREMELEKIKTELLKNSSVVSIHHVHVWAISTTENALTAHIVISEESLQAFNEIKHDLKHRLQHMNISHCTFEPEFTDEKCKQQDC